MVMKKIYQIPVTEVVEAELEQMIAVSVGIGEDYNGSDPIQSAGDDMSLFGDDGFMKDAIGF